MPFVLAVSWLCPGCVSLSPAVPLAKALPSRFLKEGQAGLSPGSPHTPPSQEFHCSHRWAELPLSCPEAIMKAKFKPCSLESMLDLCGHHRSPLHALCPVDTRFPLRVGSAAGSCRCLCTRQEELEGDRSHVLSFAAASPRGTAQGCSHRPHKSPQKPFSSHFSSAPGH